MAESKPDILRVLQAYGAETPPYPRKSGWSRMRCYIHDDQRPSAAVNVGENKWSCNACVINEDSFDVIAREEGCGFVEAKRIAIEKFGADGGSGTSVRKLSRSRPRLFDE